MKKFSWALFFVAAAALQAPYLSRAGEQSWSEKKGKHFIVKYLQDEDRDWAFQVLNAAEDYYTRIANQIGYTRYQNYWTWEDRTQIFVYPDQEAFMEDTRQPPWSQGGAVRDVKLFDSRVIITYKQETGFLDGVLPHEISHLILHDFIGDEAKIPFWFNEGVSQLQEQDKKQIARQLMENLAAKDNYVPFTVLMTQDIRTWEDPVKIKIFYAQSISIIAFLTEKYGSTNFGELCRGMRDGKSFEDALKNAYRSIFHSVQDLEDRWHKDLLH